MRANKMDKATQPLNWHELHRYNELPNHTKEALILWQVIEKKIKYNGHRKMNSIN